MNPDEQEHAEYTAGQPEISTEQKRDDMGMDNLSDKINVNVGEQAAGGAGAMLPMVAAMLGGPRDGLGGAGALGAGALGFVAGALIGGRRSGILGGGGDEGGGAETRIQDNAATLAILGKLGNIEAAIPLQTAQMTNVILAQTNEIQTLAAAAALANAQGFAAVKDSVQNVGVINLQATQAQGDRIAALINETNTANLNRLLTVADLDRRDETNRARSREVEVNVTQTVTQNQAQLQAQAQQQQQFQLLANLSACVANLANDVQVVRQGQTIFNSGTMAASGTQAAANTKVN